MSDVLRAFQLLKGEKRLMTLIMTERVLHGEPGFRAMERNWAEWTAELPDPIERAQAANMWKSAVRQIDAFVEQHAPKP